MRRTLTRALVIVALSSAGTMAFADGVGIPYYARGPRIIHVPQPGDDLRDSRASLDSAVPEDDDGDAASIAPPRRVVKPIAKPQKTAARTSPSAPPRRKPFSVTSPEPPPPPPSEPTGPRRALLSAPPPPPTSSLHDGPTPLRPTPRFGAPLPEPAGAPPALDTVPASMPAPETAASAPVDTSDDHLPPPGDPRLAPPEPTN